MKNKSLTITILSLLFISVGCKKNVKTEQQENSPIVQKENSTPQPLIESKITKNSPKRIILFIGDGMGDGAVTAASYAKGQPMHMLDMPEFSWMVNHEYEFATTDSAASATAFATGKKTHFEAVSVKPGTTDENDDDPSTHLRTIVDAAKAAGLRAGLVATSRIVHATPAAFAAHRFNRSRYDEIAVDMASSGVDLMLGAGTQFFSKDGREDKRDLFGELKEKGYTIATTPEEIEKAADTDTKVIGLLEPKDMPPVLAKNQGRPRKMSLKELTETAIKILDRNNEKGWFLMVEGSQIDWCEHDLAGLCTVAETLDFDDAVAVGRSYAQKRDDTLIVVTADHETAGVSVLQPLLYNNFANSIGGWKASEEAASYGKPGEKETIPAILEIAGNDVKYAAEQVPAKNAFGLVDLPDARFTLSFGYLSVASRHLYTGKERFGGAHTTTFVPLFSEGLGSKKIAEITDNADLGQTLIDMVDHPTFNISPPQPSGKAKNIILMIGDGMGINSVAAGYYGHGNLQMLDSPVKGIVSTNGTDFVVNDSAATATALSTGKRSRRGSLGVVYQPGQPTPIPTQTILEYAESKGARTGLVTTTPFTHATPAAFYAHVPNRTMTAQIINDFLTLTTRVKNSDGLDVAIAAGAEDFEGENAQKLQSLGYHLIHKWTDKPLKDKTLLLFPGYGLPSAEQRSNQNAPSLAQMTQAAINLLNKNKDGSPNQKGFFLMVEGGQIDWLLHGLTRTQTLVKEIIDFDNAVKNAVSFAKKDGNTLVVVTADHDHTMSIIDNHYAFKGDKHGCSAATACGGNFNMPDIPVTHTGIPHIQGFSDKNVRGDYPYPAFHIQYDWIVTMAKEKNDKTVGPHSANFVPLFAWGPGSENFKGYMTQPNVGETLKKLSNW